MWQKGEWNGGVIEEIETNTREEWLTVRNSLDGIGGSECGTVLGLDSYKSRIRLFYQKIGMVPNVYTDNIYAFMGRMLEDTIVELYEHYDEDEAVMLFNHANGIKPRKVEIRKNIMRNPDYPGLFMNVDGRVIEHDKHEGAGVLECKQVSGQVAAKWEMGFPVKYLAQVQHYMLLPNTEWAELAQLTDGVKFYVTYIPRSESIQEKLLAMIKDFMDRVKKAREIIATTKSKEKQFQFISQIEPPLEDAFDYGQFLSEKHILREKMQSVVAPQPIIDSAKKVEQIREKMKILEAAETRLVNALKKGMEDNGLREYRWEEGYIRWMKRFKIKI